MIRSFCVGALVGFLFGSSRQGAQLRESIDGFLGSLLNTEESESRNGGEQRKNSEGKKEKSGDAGRKWRDRQTARSMRRAHEDGGEEESQDSESDPEAPARKAATASGGEVGVPLAKAKQLAEALSAKPTAPESDEAMPS